MNTSELKRLADYLEHAEVEADQVCDSLSPQFDLDNEVYDAAVKLRTHIVRARGLLDYIATQVPEVAS